MNIRRDSTQARRAIGTSTLGASILVMFVIPVILWTACDSMPPPVSDSPSSDPPATDPSPDQVPPEDSSIDAPPTPSPAPPDDAQDNLGMAQMASWQVLAANDRASIIGSAFAVDQQYLVTNAHVVVGIADVLARPGAAAGIVQHETGATAMVQEMWIHPDYNGNPATSPDVGIIKVDQQLTTLLPLADETRAQSIAVLDDLLLCGFPGDVTLAIDIQTLLTGDNYRPRATCLTGQVTALRPFDSSVPATPSNTLLLQHDIATTGGTSGSAILDVDGFVIAVNAASTTDASGLNRFAPRVDTIQILLDQVLNASLQPVIIEIDPGCLTETYYNPEFGFGISNLPPEAGALSIASDPTGVLLVQWKGSGVYAGLEYRIEVYNDLGLPLDELGAFWMAFLQDIGLDIIDSGPFTFGDGRPGWFVVSRISGNLFVDVLDRTETWFYLATGIGAGAASNETPLMGKEPFLTTLAGLCVER